MTDIVPDTAQHDHEHPYKVFYLDFGNNCSGAVFENFY